MTIRTLLTRLLLLMFLGGVVPAFAINRVVTITAPTQAVTGTKAKVVVTASTDASDGEKIDFFHAEYSVDNGRTWTGFCYDEKVGRSATRSVEIPVGARGSKAMVRVLIAFRGGKSGDVDFNGAPIQWDGSWKKWQSPPAKLATIEVIAL